MANKFLTNVELEAGLVDGSNSTGTSGYLLSSTGTATSWVDPAAVSVGESEQVHIACKNTSGVAISKGDPVYITGTVGTSFKIQIAAADASNSAKMPAVGLAETDLGLNDEGFVIVSGVLKNLTTDPLSTSDGTPSSNDTVYVKAGGGLTKTKPTGSGNLIQNVGKVGRVNSANAGSLAVSTIMRTNDVPNLTTGKIWVGSPTYTTESTVVHLDETNGRMGIGTTSPADIFHVDGARSNFNGIKIGENSTNIQFTGDGKLSVGNGNWLIFSEGGQEFMRAGGTGNVGIGTTSPSSPLTFGKSVYGDFDSENFYRIKLQDQGGTLNDVGIGQTASGSMGFNITSGNAFIFNNGTSGEIARFNGTGLGIGTNNPQEELHIASTVPVIRIEDTDGGYAQVVGSNGSLSLRSDQANTVASSIIDFSIDNSEKMRIDSSGNVGIGTTSPTEKLQVNGNVKISNGGLAVENSTSHGYVALPGGAFYHSSSGSETGAIKITLPTHGTADMLSFVVDVFDYTTNESFSLNIKGYLYQTTGNNEWVNVSAQTIASNINRNFTIRFGADGSNNCVWIGETNSSWSYPQIQVRDFTAGFSADIDSFIDGWDVDIVTSFDTVDETYFSPFPMSKEVYGSGIHLRGSGNSYFNGGNVGIGTTSPSQKLDVSGNIKMTETAATTDTDKFVVSDGGVLKYRTGAQVLSDIGAGTGDVGGSGTTNYIPKWSNSSTLTDSGIVETSTLTTINNASFEYDYSGTTYLNIDGTTGTFLLGQHSTTNRSYIHGLQTHLRFYTNNVKAGEFDSNQNFLVTNGNVGIGVTSPTTKLDVDGITTGLGFRTTLTNSNYSLISRDSAGNSPLYVQSANSSTNQTIAKFNYGSASANQGQNVLTVAKDKSYFLNTNVGIGTTNPSYKLDIAGNLRVDNGNIGSTSGDELTHARVQGARHFIDFKEVRTANDTDWKNTTFKIQTGVDATKHQSIDFVSDGSYREHIDILTGNQVFNTRFTYDGKVGIGTTSPGKQLTLSAATPFIRLQETGAANKRLDLWVDSNAVAHIDANQSAQQITFRTASTDRLRIANNGNVGIGTTSPAYTLDVNGTLHSSNITLADGIYHEGDTNTYINFLTDQIQMATAGSVRAYINSLGNVGIGTTSPASQLGSTKVLDISSTGNGEIILDHTDAGVSSDIGLYSWNRNNDHLAHIKASCDGATDSAFISFHTQATGGSFTNAASNERMRITSTGNVGIGTTSPSSLFHLQKTLSGGQVMAYFDGAAGSGAYGAVNIRVDNIDYGTGMRFHRSGTYDSGAVGFINGTSTVGSININTSSTSYNTTSDYRLKENLTEITDGIDRIKQLKPKRFNFIGDTEIVDGFIAHEAKQVVPEAVTGEKDEVLPNGDPVYQGIDQSKIVPLLTAALQEAITKIEILENRLQTLENK